MKTPLESADLIRHQIWKELARATHDRHHAWRTPTLATITRQGQPNARTVVLRKVQHDLHGGTLEIYTDRRSPKVVELMEQPSASLVFWSARLKWQLRVRADIAIQTEGPYVASLWQVVRQSKAAGDYLGLLPPGQVLPNDGVTNLEPSMTDERESHFAVLTAQVQEIDWLELGHGQHRRCRFVGSQWQWLTP